MSQIVLRTEILGSSFCNMTGVDQFYQEEFHDCMMKPVFKGLPDSSPISLSEREDSEGEPSE